MGFGATVADLHPHRNMKTQRDTCEALGAITAQMTEVIHVCFLKCFCEQRHLASNKDISDHELVCKSESLWCPLPPLKDCPNDPAYVY
ncbi:hypothetical protein TNCV_2651491 [Trichonephila clavipes]|nr:hypothetical protein TNCV_2651491 [Trichonephila clavipes]